MTSELKGQQEVPLSYPFPRYEVLKQKNVNVYGVNIGKSQEFVYDDCLLAEASLHVYHTFVQHVVYIS